MWGLSSEDKAEGLDPEAGVVQRGQASRVGRPEGVTPTPVGEDEVLVKKWSPQEGEAASVLSPERQRLARGG